MAFILPRTGAAGIADLNCIGRDGDVITRIGIGPTGRAIGLITPIGRIIGRAIIGRGRWAATGVLDAPISTRPMNAVKNLDPSL
jgi:hypothetical protein